MSRDHWLRRIREAFSAQFLADVTEVWEKRGKAAILQTAHEDPAKFVQICASLIPKTIEAITPALPGGLDQADWMMLDQVLRAVKEALPGAGERNPADVFAYVLEALRAYGATTITA